MAAFPPLAQVAGSHGGIYEAYYLQADPKGTGSIGALDAATFLKKSKLSDAILSKVWDLSDPTGKGYLEKPGFFIALKYISMAQNGQELNSAMLTSELPPPNLGPVEVAPVNPALVADVPWDVTPSEKAKYDHVFETLQPVNGLLSGDKVKPVLLNSKLPTDVLGKIWDLSDINKDGYLDKDEFAVTMHLVYRIRENDPVPNVLPLKMIPPSKRPKAPVAGGVPGTATGAPVLPGAVPVLPAFPATVPVLPGVAGLDTSGTLTPPTSKPEGSAKPWVVTAAEKANSDAMFLRLDTDMDGLVSGAEVRNVFVQSGLPNPLLAHIWSLCDMNSTGKLNSDLFALAMYLVQQKLKGVDPPGALTPEMIPPSMRPKSTADTATFGVKEGANAGPYGGAADFSAIKELDSISKEIEDIKKEKMQLERDKQQREADIKIRQGEVQMLQKELDAMTATLHQLENQKKEAQKRLDELDDKKKNLESSVKELREKCEKEQAEIDAMRMQLSNRAKSAEDQEAEMNSLSEELGKLREEESSLEQKVESGKQQLELLIKSQRDVMLQVNQTKTRTQHLRDQHRALTQSIAGYSPSPQLNGDFSSDTDQFSSRATAGSSPVSNVSGLSGASVLDDFKEDPFKGKDPFSNMGENFSQADPFQNEDPFKDSDPFKSSDGFSADPFAAEDPFKDAFGTSAVGNKPDPFGNQDPFANAFSSTAGSDKKSGDGFDAFGFSSTKEKTGDNFFAGDPFAPKPSTMSESPKPALPPKQKRQPPPRPAPPKSKSPANVGGGPKPKVDPFWGLGNDPFAGKDTSGDSGGDPFANFADFSPGKFEDDKSAWGSAK
ncbi:epidermal growth factor receptor substrate 15-like 1 isoform X2 [Gigantopelta aegis]|uniref:epidermal growth factor receptor substrate 15-like 1 isoform X2 n=1 Tax=Gigantopelta aegis TaxID=1735272 RepID=UPI001B889095|nr:epidermal growth factor receptor substrate 15-like 1 isoform X2 [Gigantopelta aegis]